MNTIEIDNQILVKQIQLRGEHDPMRRENLNKQIQTLQLKREIENIRKRIEQLR